MSKLKKISIFVIAFHATLICLGLAAQKPLPPASLEPIAIKSYVLPKPQKPAVKPAKPTIKPAKIAPPKPKKARDVKKEMQKSIAKIPPKQDNYKHEAKPKPQYPLLLVQTLKRALHLPEEGDVKLMLTIRANGEVIDVQILSSLSTRNADYLKAEIPQLRFPSFTPELGMKQQNSFTLTFRHDD